MFSTRMTTSTCELVVKGTVDGVDNFEEKTREVADIRMCPFGCIFLYR